MIFAMQVSYAALIWAH